MNLIEWDSGVVAAGAVIHSPVFSTRDLEFGIYAIVINSSAATRNLTMDSLLSDGTAVDSGLVIRTVATGPVTERGVIGGMNAALGTPALIFAYPIILPTLVQFHLVAGGAANGRVVLFGR